MVRKADIEDLQVIYDLIHKVKLDSSMFLKPENIKSVLKRIKYSYVYEHENSIKGVVLIDYKIFNNSKKEVWTIDNIVSFKKGAATKLLKDLPKKDYYCTIAFNNEKSKNLFKKQGFKSINYMTYMGYQREIFFKGVK